jgi:hypothetical protein
MLQLIARVVVLTHVTRKDFTSTNVKKKTTKGDEEERKMLEVRSRVRNISSLIDEIINGLMQVFQDWMNLHLKKRDVQVVDFRKDLFDGRLLMLLLEVVFQRPLLPMVEVESEFQAINNITIVLDIFRNEGGSLGPEVTASGAHYTVMVIKKQCSNVTV